jgi:HEPN domain-containing protein
MKRKRLPPSDAREWISRAKSNLVLAGNIVPGVDLEDLCFETQQAAEKAVKAVLVFRSEPFPYIHDLKKLLMRLERNGLKIPKNMCGMPTNLHASP